MGSLLDDTWLCMAKQNAIYSIIQLQDTPNTQHDDYLIEEFM